MRWIALGDSAYLDLACCHHPGSASYFGLSKWIDFGGRERLWERGCRLGQGIPRSCQSDRVVGFSRQISWDRLSCDRYHYDAICNNPAGVLGLKQLHSFCTTYPVLARRIVTESGSSQTLQISEPWYPFALVGIHVTRTILETLSAGLLQRNLIMKAHGNLVESVGRTCQDIFGNTGQTPVL